MNHTNSNDLSDEKRMYVSDLATLAESSYKRTLDSRVKYASQHLHDANDFSIVPDYRSANHTLYHDNKRGQYVLSVAGTNIDGAKGTGRKMEDLITDAVLAIGGASYAKLMPRYKQSQRELKKVQQMISEDGEPLVLVGHSLAGNLVRSLGIENDLESHSFAPGSSPISVYKDFNTALLSPQVRDRLKKNHSYHVIDNGIDVLSHSDSFNPFTNNYVFKLRRDDKNLKRHKDLKKSVLPHHSIVNFQTK
jgi:predicted esterase YcpF (UPF0227 family)